MSPAAANLNNLSDSMSHLSIASQGSNIPQQGPINNLSALEAVQDDVFQQVFWDNRVLIFANTKSDIEDALLKRNSLDTLQSLRDMLINIAKNMFTLYSDRTPISRRAKNTVITDIYNLGYSIINENATYDLDSAFQKNAASSVDTDKVIDLSRIITMVTEMQASISSNAKEIKSLKNECKTLKNDNKVLADEIKILRAGNNTSPNTLKQSPQSSATIIKPSRLSNNSNAGQIPPPLTPTTASKDNATSINNNNSSTGQTTPPKTPTTASKGNATPINNDSHVNVSPLATNSNALHSSTVQHPQKTICKSTIPLVLSDSSESSDSENEHTAKPSLKTKKKSKSVTVPNLIKVAPKPVNDLAPIKAATKPKKLVDMFIGNLDKSVTATAMLSHIKSFEIPIVDSAITGVPQRSGNKAFKVSIDKSYVTILEKIWPDGIIVNEFKEKKKDQAKKQPFHKKYPKRNHSHNSWGDQRSNDRANPGRHNFQFPQRSNDRAWPGRHNFQFPQRSNDREWHGRHNFQFPQRSEFGQYGYPHYYPY